MPLPKHAQTLVKAASHAAVLASACLMLSGCGEPVNSPRDLAEYSTNTLFSSFSGRSPKTLDPQASYSSDETLYTYSIYEPPYGYHYLKRPYELQARAAAEVVEPVYVDGDGGCCRPTRRRPASIGASTGPDKGRALCAAPVLCKGRLGRLPLS